MNNNSDQKVSVKKQGWEYRVIQLLFFIAMVAGAFIAQSSLIPGLWITGIGFAGLFIFYIINWVTNG